MQEVEALCDRVIIIHNGSIIANDDIDTLRNSASESVAVQVVFDKEVSAKNIAALQGAMNVTHNGSAYNIETNDAAAFKKELMQFSIQEGLNINSLSQGTKNLEEVFRQLTDNAAKSAAAGQEL